MQRKSEDDSEALEGLRKLQSIKQRDQTNLGVI